MIGIIKLINFNCYSFTKAWELRKLHDLTSKIGSGKTPRGGERSYVDHGIPLIRSQNINMDAINLENVAYITKETNLKMKQSIVKENDILLNITGASIGRSAVYKYSFVANVNQHVCIIRLKSNELADFFQFQLSSYKGQHNIMLNQAGGGREGLNFEQIGNLSFSLPKNLEEIIPISHTLILLSSTIALQQEQLDLYKKLKKGLLQKLFPKDGEKIPEVRFADFTGDWEQHYLSTLATIHARIGWQNLRTSEFLNEGKYILITGTDFKNGNIDYSNIHFVSKERFEQDKKIQVQNGSILITKDGTLGKVAYVQGLSAPATLNAGVFNVIIKKNINVNSKYLFHYLNAPFLLRFASTHSTGGTIKHLNQNILTKFPIPISSLDEQNKISNFLTLLNNLITLQQEKVNELEALKKYLLQKLFI